MLNPLARFPEVQQASGRRLLFLFYSFAQSAFSSYLRGSAVKITKAGL